MSPVHVYYFHSSAKATAKKIIELREKLNEMDKAETETLNIIDSREEQREWVQQLHHHHELNSAALMSNKPLHAM